MRLLLLLTIALPLTLAACDDGGSSGGYSPSYSSSRSSPAPSWTRMPSERSSCGTGRNFC